MTVKRFFAFFFGIIGALVLVVALYLSFGDLGRHKGRIEALVTKSIGRPFAIDGPFTLKLIPVIDVSAERVRLGNMQGGSQPQMVEFGKAVVQIRFWSLISGPPEVKLFELHDATVLLERGPEGKGNWVMDVPKAEDEADSVDETEAEPEEEVAEVEVPVVIDRAVLNNVRLIYREAQKSDQVVLFEKLTITPGQGDLLALDGQGMLDAYPMTIKGELGTIKSLLAQRDMRLALQMSLGKLALDVKGAIGSWNPLDGADLTLKVEHPELDSMLTKLEVPVFATGPLKIDGRVKDDGVFTNLDFKARAGDFSASAIGSIKELSLVGADLAIKIEHTEIGPLLEALKLPVVATGPTQVDARIKDVGKHRELDFKATLGDLTASVKGTFKTRGLAGADLTIKAEKGDVGPLLTALKLPVVATGLMQIDTRIKDVGKYRQLDLEAKLGDLTASVKGTFKTRGLAGADLTIKAEKGDVGPLLTALKLPVVATGLMQIDTRIKDVGKHRQLDLKAKIGDLDASVKGTLKTRGLVGSDLKFEATAADAARLASVFEVRDVPASPLTVSGHTVYSSKQVTFEALTAAIAGASVRLDGSMQHTGDRAASLKFVMSAESLAKLRATLPELKVSASGALELTKGRIEAKDLQALLGENQLAGSFLLTDAKVIEAQISSPRLDLTPFMSQEKPAGAADAATAQPAAAPAAAPAAPAKPEPAKKFVFSEKPFPFDKMKDTDAKLHLVCGELIIGERSVKDLDSNVHVDHGKITFDMRAAGAHEGTLQGAGTLVPAADGTADLALKIDLSDVRANLGNKDIARADVPPVGLKLDIKIHGNSPRQMAAGANGYLLLTQGAGKMRSGLISAYGGGVISELTQKLNPFAKDDPFMKLDCTIARADIVNGEMTVSPVVIQSEKVTITAHGNIDLRTEKLLLDFNTRPRKGIGVSPGMFTNPLIRLEGTLVSPRIGVGAKGVASGALAAATGGATVVAGGFFDRLKGEKDVCKATLAAATNPAAAQSKK